MSEVHPADLLATIVSIPVGGRAAYNMTSPSASIETFYEAMLKPPFAAQFARVVDEITHAQTPVLIHGTAGKNRTGLLVALVLCLLEADATVIGADAAATTAALPEILARFGVRS